MTHNELASLADRVEALTGPDRSILDRLDRSGSCWLWTGKLDVRGRGRVWRGGKIMLHHRAVWEILIGPIPDGALLCHHCDNPRCANPSHIYVGNGKSNVADMFGRGRAWQIKEPDRARFVAVSNGLRNNWSRGERNPKAKLSRKQVEEIRQTSGSSYHVARMFGVHATSVQRIRKGEAWTS